MASTNSYPGLEPSIVALVRHHAKRVAASDHRLEQQDVEQELHLQLHARASGLDLSRGSRTTYQHHVVRNRAADLARNARVAKRGAPWASAPLEDVDRIHDNLEPGRQGVHARTLQPDHWEDAASLRLDLARFLSAQPRHLQECCRLLLKHSVTETARSLGHHRCTVYAWMAALRERACSAGLDIYVGP
jgi:Sigma-70 region 2